MNGQAKWIWKNANNRKDDYAGFTAPFEYTGGRAYIRISADSEYAVFINGKFVYAGQYADFPWYKIYDSIEITEYLTRGKNICEVWVWRCGDVNFCHYVNRSAVRFEITGGGSVLFTSDENTLSRSLPVFKSGHKKTITKQIGYSFLADYAKRSGRYRKSVIVSGMPEKVFPRPVERLLFKNKIPAEKISKNVFDLGRETVVIPYLTGTIPYGETIAVSFGEWLDGDRVPRYLGERDCSFSAPPRSADGCRRAQEVAGILRSAATVKFRISGSFRSNIRLRSGEFHWKESAKGYTT